MARRDPERLDAWILGSGVASLTAAVHLIQEVHVPPSRIHIIESLSVPGGVTASHGDAENGYDLRIQPHYNGVCMDATLSLVPSTSDPSRSVRDEILEFATSLETQPPRTVFLGHKSNGVGRVDAKKMALGWRDRIDLFTLASKSEKTLGRARICDFVNERFFRSAYWLALAASFGLKPSHSAAEFRRYLHRFSNLHDLQHPYLLDLGKYSVHESIMVPVVQFLMSRGVDFRLNTTICDISFAKDNPNKPNDPTRITAIQTSPVREPCCSVSSKDEKTIQVSPDDIVIVSLGSIFSTLLPGTNTHPPPSLHLDPTTITDPETSMEADTELDENWLLWLELCTKHPKFGNAYNFCTRLHSSRLESFTITLSSTELFSRLTETTAQTPGPNTLLTLHDSPWLVTLRIPHQPVLPDQPPHIQVCWGYALAPERSGTHIQKPMIDCSGQEILSEILSQLGYPLESILEKAVTIPCIQPRGAATLLPRIPRDRPAVIPEGMRNMAVIGPFVEIADEAFTTDYSVRGAQIAVRELMGVGTVVGKSKKGFGL